jgi:hypothetical protein
MGSIAKWLEDKRISESVAYIFEAGDEDQYPLREAVLAVSQSRTFVDALRLHSLTLT